jgi:hypothetical protein
MIGKKKDAKKVIFKQFSVLIKESDILSISLSFIKASFFSSFLIFSPHYKDPFCLKIQYVIN